MLSGRTEKLACLKPALSHTEQRKVKTNVGGSLRGQYVDCHSSIVYIDIHWLFTQFASQPLLECRTSHLAGPSLPRIGADKLRSRTSMH